MYEVAASEGTGHEWCNHVAIRSADANAITDMHKHVAMSESHKTELSEVGVRREILECVQCLSKQTERLKLVFSAIGRLVLAAHMDAAL